MTHSKGVPVCIWTQLSTVMAGPRQQSPGKAFSVLGSRRSLTANICLKCRQQHWETEKGGFQKCAGLTNGWHPSCYETLSPKLRWRGTEKDTDCQLHMQLDYSIILVFICKLVNIDCNGHYDETFINLCSCTDYLYSVSRFRWVKSCLSTGVWKTPWEWQE